MKKERLDLLLVARGFAASRERAKRLIMAGQVLVDEQRVDKGVELLHDIARDERQCEEEEKLRGASLGHIFCHVISPSST